MSKFLYLSDVIAQKQKERDAEQIRWAKEDARERVRDIILEAREGVIPEFAKV